MVMTQGIWASLRGLPFFAQIHGDASCADLRHACLGERYSKSSECRRRKTCDAYSDQDGWEEYFEPIHGRPFRRVLRNASESRIIELSCPAAWYYNQGVLGGHTDVGIYATDWKTASAFRERNAALVAAWVRVRPSIRAQAEAEWRRITRGATAVIGVHLRGTDKFVMPKVPPERYYALIDAFVAQHGGCANVPHPLIYLATDDSGYQLTFLRRYGKHCVAQLNDGNVKRANRTHALWADRGVAGDAHSKGLEVILDALLLSKSAFLLKTASSVSEFAIYWNPRLANNSYDFNLEGQPEPSWFARKAAGGQAIDLAEDPASKCVDQERDGEAAVHHWQLRRGEMLCASHGWQGACKPPCTTVGLSVEPTAICNDPLHPPHPAANEPITRQLLAMAERARGVAARPTYRWSGKVLRIRSFADDGFWVRAQFVLTQGLWASLRGLPFFVDMQNASCKQPLSPLSAETAHGRGQRRMKRQQQPEQCDAYSSPSDDGSAGWEEYFEPIGGVALSEVYKSTPEASIIELSCSAAWYANEGVMGGRMATEAEWGSGYPRTRQEAVQMRTRNAALVAAWVRVRPSIRAQAEAEWRRITRGATAVIGVHLRGTDKFVMPKVPPERYYALIDAFVSSHGASDGAGAIIFLATDDLGYQRAMVERYGAHRVAQLLDGKIRRAEGQDAIWRQHSADAAHAKGLEVLLDTLLLAKCDFVLKSASAVSEFALYFAPRLINHSFDFSLQEDVAPPWATEGRANALD